AYISAQMIYQLMLCAAQTVVTVCICLLTGIKIPLIGLVTPVGSGEAVITVKTTDGGLKATCAVTVTVPVTGISGPEEKTFYVGQKTALGIATVPANATNRAITYTIADSSIATIGSDGSITPLKNGRTSVTAKTVEGGFSKTMRILVETKVSGITLDKKELRLGVGDTRRLIASVAPTTATNKKVIWKSGNETVATVSETGEITAKSLGVAVITATTEDGKKAASCTVTVLVPVSSITLSTSTLRLTKGEQATLTAVIDPANATYQTVVWSSDNSLIASVSSNGVVTGNDRGNAVITAMSEDGTVQATCVVSVSEVV
ncbi:MAG: Ig-like domain-containing protein, partial [Clostridia bacterium]|nr:Ig-like domain-containing protein [Clostridia bacterium]